MKNVVNLGIQLLVHQTTLKCPFIVRPSLADHQNMRTLVAKTLKNSFCALKSIKIIYSVEQIWDKILRTFFLTSKKYCLRQLKIKNITEHKLL